MVSCPSYAENNAEYINQVHDRDRGVEIFPKNHFKNEDKILNSIINNGFNFGNTLSILGVVLTIIFSVNSKHKRVKYYLGASKKGNEILLAFWNASNVTVYGDDIYNNYFELRSNKSIKIKNHYVSDMIKTEIFSRYRYTGLIYYIRFDMLLPKKGILYKIEAQEPVSKIKIDFIGRLKGEDHNSVSYYRSVKSGHRWKLRIFLGELLTNLGLVLTVICFIFSVCMAVLALFALQKGLFWFFVWTSGFYIIWWFFYFKKGFVIRDRLPKDLKKQINEYKRGRRIKPVKDGNKITSYCDEYLNWKQSHKI